MTWKEQRQKICNGLLKWNQSLNRKIAVSNYTRTATIKAKTEEEFLALMNTMFSKVCKDEGVRGMLKVLADVTYRYEGEESGE